MHFYKKVACKILKTCLLCFRSEKIIHLFLNLSDRVRKKMTEQIRKVRSVSAATLHLRSFLTREFFLKLPSVFSATNVISELPEEAKFFNEKEIKNIKPLINTELKKIEMVELVENHKVETPDGGVKKLGRSPLYFQLKK